MALVYYEEEVFGEVVKECEGWLAASASVEVAAVVLHARTETDFPDHFEVVVCSLL
jgi:hypothetical protein